MLYLLHQPLDKVVNIPSNSSCGLQNVEKTSLFIARAPKTRMQWINNFQVLDTVIKLQVLNMSMHSYKRIRNSKEVCHVNISNTADLINT